MEPFKMTLTTPIQAHGQSVSELTLRPMTGKDLRTNGFPYAFGEDGGRLLNMPAMAAHIGALAGIPPSSVDQLSPPDMTTALGAVLAFFNGVSPATGAPPGPASAVA